ncbi:MAG: DUF5995 family protein [Actinomycetota bacterium]|nr:DUF5995 family protein [Actinomycetota bacterium]
MAAEAGPQAPGPVAEVVARMQQRLDVLPPDLAYRKYFLGTYLRTTLAVGAAIDTGRFEDPAWVERWDVVFAELFIRAHDADRDGLAAEVPRPWRLAFDIAPDQPPLRHVLVGINAHVNYDLPQALLAVISDADFTAPGVLDRRRRDHEQIDGVLSSRVAAEDAELASGGRALLDKLLAPLNRLGSKRFLRESRQKVWHNAIELQKARVAGQAAYDARLAELEVLSAARIADLVAPGQVLLKLAVAGFGVMLPPPR